MGKNTRKNKITKTRTLVNRKILQRKNKEIMDLKNEISNLKKYYSKDNLTNTFNKSNGIRRLQLELNRTIAQNAPTTIAFIDVDNMKAINDNFGHCSGDKLLFSLGSVITSSIRKDDFVFRFGGDEFVIVFPNADKEQATKIIRRIQESISAINQKEKLPFYISISYGISEYNGNTKIKINEFIKNADIAMYQNKNLNKANMNQEKNLVLN